MRVAIVLIFAMVFSLMLLPAEAKKKQLKLKINKDDVNLAERTIYFKLNRPAESAEIKVFSVDGQELASKIELYNSATAGTRLAITWPELIGDDANNFRIELKVTDVDEYWVGWEIVRFYVEIPHEEVVFESGKWEVRATEAPKLDEALKLLVEALQKHGKNLQCNLYVAGYTDTVGSISDNRELSRKRAKAISTYFIQHGLKKLPIFIRGFGEESPAVETADNVPEERNRRADYIIATFPPEMSGPGSWQKVQ